jgi:hypothetical protein
MIGTRIDSRRSVSAWMVFLIVAALGVCAVGIVLRKNDLLFGAILPLAIAGALALFGWRRSFAGTFRDNGLEIENGDQPALIPYSSIQSIRVGGKMAEPAGLRQASGVITIVHEGGVIRIPARLNLPTDDVYRFLVGQIPDQGGRAVNSVIADYLARQERDFGADHVATFCAANRRVGEARIGLRALSLGLFLTSIVWLFIGSPILGRSEGWKLAGVVCLPISTVLFLVSFAQNLSVELAVKNWKKASLVIAPRGMAMVQGEIEGEVNWPELLEVRFHPRPRSFTLTRDSLTPGILLRVKGATIVIVDIYDRPLFVIYRRIVAAWRKAKGPSGE